MKLKARRILGLLLAAAICASLLAAMPASAADNDPTTWTSKIGKNTAKLVTVPMVPGRTGEISLANNSVVESTSYKTLIDQKDSQANTHVVAAINGGFFNSYTSKPWAFPNKCPTIMDAVVINGKLIHSGRTATLGFTADGRAMVDWVTLTHQVRLGNGATVGGDWGVNTYLDDPYAVMLFNEHLTLPVPVPASATMVYIQDNKVTQITAGGTLTVPKGTDVLVYGSEIAAYERSRETFPQVGMSARIVLTAKGTNRDAEWARVESALTGGPVLVKDGKNVVNDANNQGFYIDPKQRPTYSAGRSFVGITWNGSLVMGTVSGTFSQIADWMVENGIQDGIAMDGGASSMLYANGAYVTPGGRDLASVLTIVDRTDGGSLPAESNMDSPDVDLPTPWAVDEVNSAIAAGLVPDGVNSGFMVQNLQKDYRQPITRQDFCLLIWALIQKQPDYNSRLQANPPVTFSDVNTQNGTGEWIQWVARLGIVQGVGGDQFNPYAELTREQAAKILALTAQFLGVEDTKEQFYFADRDSFSGWAHEYIDFCGVNKIMGGIGDDRFGPGDPFNRDQAIATIYRIYTRYSAK